VALSSKCAYYSVVLHSGVFPVECVRPIEYECLELILVRPKNSILRLYAWKSEC